MLMNTFTMPAGKYYVGDLCYVMHPQWDEFCDKTIDGHDVLEGILKLDFGVTIVHFCTAYGDGVYYDENGLEYGVDAGLIGCIRVEDIDDSDCVTEWGNIIDFKEDFKCYNENGILHFGHICIDTSLDEGEDEKEYE